MPRHGGTFAVGLIAAASCGVDQLRLGPPLGTIGTALVAVAENQTLGSVQVFEGVPSDLVVEVGSEATLHFVTWDRSPADLCLPTGSIELDESGARQPIPPGFTSVSSLSPGDSSWRSSPELPAVLVDRTMPDICRAQLCRPFEARPIELTAMARVRFVGELDGASVLVSTTDGLFRIEEDEVTEVATGTRAGFRASMVRAGHLWLAGTDGFLGRVELSALGKRDIERLPIPTGNTIVSLSGSETADEVYVADNRSGLIRVTSEGSTEIIPAGEEGDPRVAWIGPGEVLRVGAKNRVDHLSNGRLVDERAGDGNEELNAIAATPVGIVVGSDIGRFYVRRSGDWTLLADWNQNSIRAIAPFLDGFVAVGNRGRAQVFRPGVGLCQELVSISDDHVGVSTVGDEFYAGGAGGQDEKRTVIWHFVPR